MYKRIILKLSGETLAPDASKPDAPRGVVRRAARGRGGEMF